MPSRMMRDVQIALYDMVTSTTPESNKSHLRYLHSGCNELRGRESTLGVWYIVISNPPSSLPIASQALVPCDDALAGGSRPWCPMPWRQTWLSSGHCCTRRSAGHTAGSAL